MLFRRITSPGSLKPAQFIAAAQTGNASASTNLIINKPAGTAQGDLMIAVVSRVEDAGSGNWALPAGWTKTADQGGGAAVSIAWKIAGASEGADYTFVHNSSKLLAGAILTYRGGAYGVTGAFGTATAPTAVAAPSITPTAVNALVLAAYAEAAAATWTTPSGFTNRVALSTNGGISVSEKSNATPTASGAVSATPSGTSPCAGILISINPS
jgi:hypothetical protein